MVLGCKESINQGGHFLDFRRFSWSCEGPKFNLHTRTEISLIVSLTPKPSLSSNSISPSFLKMEIFTEVHNSKSSVYHFLWLELSFVNTLSKQISHKKKSVYFSWVPLCLWLDKIAIKTKRR